MNFDKRQEFYEKLYFHEVDMREKIEARIRTPLSLFAVGFGLIAYITRELFAKTSIEYNYFIWIPYWIGCATYLVALFFLCRALYGYHYILMPTTDTLENYRNEIREKYRNIDETEWLNWTNEAFEEYIFGIYVHYTSHNTKNNDAKAMNISLCTRTLIFALFLVATAYVPFFVLTYSLELSP